MRRLLQISLSACLFICSAASLYGQGDTSVASRPASPKRQGFFDYALGKINPSGTDYGASLSAQRGVLVEHTVDDLYFWSNALTLLLLSGAATVILFQWRSAEKKEVIVSAMIAQLWNGRASDRVELDKRTRQYNELVQRHNLEAEQLLSTTAAQSTARKDDGQGLSRSVRTLSESAQTSPEKRGPRNKESATGSAQSVAQEPGRGTDQDNLLLRRQVEAMQNTEQNLKQRLNQTMLLLDEERRKNATLKGA